jgi:hypothetical protein
MSMGDFDKLDFSYRAESEKKRDNPRSGWAMCFENPMQARL